MFTDPNEVVAFEFLCGILVVLWYDLEGFAAEDVSVEIEAEIGDDEVEEGVVYDGVGEGSQVGWLLADGGVVATLPPSVFLCWFSFVCDGFQKLGYHWFIALFR